MSKATLMQLWQEKMIPDKWESLPRLDVSRSCTVASEMAEYVIFFMNFYDETVDNFGEPPDYDAGPQLPKRCFVRASLCWYKAGALAHHRVWDEPTASLLYIEISPRQVLDAVDRCIAKLLPVLEENGIPADPQRWH